MQDALRLLLLAATWAGYFALHSLLAGRGLKAEVARRWPRLARRYRLAYNVTALVTLVPVLALMAHTPGPWLWRWEGAWGWLADGLALGALAGFAWSARYYDLGEFAGLDRAGAEGPGGLRISPLHRHVRHPWYSLGLVLIWTRDMDAAWLVSALVITAYLVVGSRLEERRLVAEFGEAYRAYKRRVPGLVPLPGRALSRAEAWSLEQQARAAPPQGAAGPRNLA